MFRNRPEKIVLSNDTRVSGIFTLVRQGVLTFGGNRKPPVTWRPCMSVQRPEPFWIVLPATTKKNRNQEDFFPVPPEQVLFQKQQPKTTYLFYRYETVSKQAFGEKIGLVGQVLRIAISAWFCQRWGIQGNKA